MMDEIIKKADILVEALPYIKEFQGKIVVIKYGGQAIANEQTRKSILQDIIFMNTVGIKPVLVHGGGPTINRRFLEKGITPKFIKGMRVTEKKDLKIVKEVLSEINKQLTSEINNLGHRAEGLDGFSNKIIKVKKHKEVGKLGYVGEVVNFNLDLINIILTSKIIPIISPLGIDNKNECFNINADSISSKLAIALKACKLMILTDVVGIMRIKRDESSLISTLMVKDIDELIERKVIAEGMIPKVKACIETLQGGVEKTHIIDGRLPHALLLEVFTDKGIGTQILNEAHPHTN